MSQLVYFHNTGINVEKILYIVPEGRHGIESKIVFRDGVELIVKTTVQNLVQTLNHKSKARK